MISSFNISCSSTTSYPSTFFGLGGGDWLSKPNLENEGAAIKNTKRPKLNGNVNIGTPQLAVIVNKEAWIASVKIQHKTGYKS